MIDKLKGDVLTRYIDETIAECEKWLLANASNQEKKTKSGN